MLDKKVFICHPNKLLLHKIKTDSEECWRELANDLVVMTDEVDYEKDLEGWGPSISRAAKAIFINSLIDDFSAFETREQLTDVLGPGSAVEVFDRWFEIFEVEFLQLPANSWKQV